MRGSHPTLVVLGLLATSGTLDASPPPPLDQALQTRVQEHLHEKARLEAGDYELAWAVNWPHGSIPILWAHPTQNLPRSIPVAVLPGRLVTPFESGALETVYAALPPPDVSDARMLAQLALWFG